MLAYYQFYPENHTSMKFQAKYSYCLSNEFKMSSARRPPFYLCLDVLRGALNIWSASVSKQSRVVKTNVVLIDRTKFVNKRSRYYISNISLLYKIRYKTPLKYIITKFCYKEHNVVPLHYCLTNIKQNPFTHVCWTGYVLVQNAIFH